MTYKTVDDPARNLYNRELLVNKEKMMAPVPGFIEVRESDIRLGIWQYTGGTIRFVAGRMYVAAPAQKKVDTRDER